MTKNLYFSTLLFLLLSLSIYSQPTISSFSPSSGPIGTSVTIAGTNFDLTPSNNIVFFGATQAIVTAGTSTSLTVTVPTGTTYQYISVTDITTNLSAYSTTPFNPTFSCGGIINTAIYAPKTDIPAGSFPSSVSIEDLDGDGKSDLVVANEGSGSSGTTVAVFMNTTIGNLISFAPALNFTTGTGPLVISIAEIDGDGKQDLVVANTNAGSISVLRNTSTPGSISFAAKVDFTTPTTPRGISVSDFNGDGKLDVVTANFGFSVNTISVFKNTSTIGSISFAARVDFTAGNRPNYVTTGDVDGDNKPDIIATNNTSNTISVFRNISTLATVSFSPKVDYTTGTTPVSVAMGDIDTDGKADLAIANSGSNTLSVFRNLSTPGTISFAAKIDFTTGAVPYNVTIADVDGDGLPDLGAACGSSNAFSLLKNASISGTLSFSAKVDFTTGATPSFISIGDLDGDQLPEALTANKIAGGTISVLKGMSSFTPTTLTATSITTHSFNANWNPAAGGLNYFLDVYLDPAFTLPVSGYSNLNVGSATTHPITGLSLNTSYYYRVRVSVACGLSSYSLTRTVITDSIDRPAITSFTPTTGAPGTSVTISGTNFSTIPSNSIVFFGATQAIVTASTDTSLSVIVPSGATHHYISVTDTNHLTAYSNKKFIVTTQCGGTINTSSFAPRVDFAVAGTAYYTTTKDLDFDGKPDLIVSCNGGNKVCIYPNTSSIAAITFGVRIDLTPGVICGGVVAADLNGDGKQDIIVTNKNNFNVSVFMNTSTAGSISFTPKIDFTTGSDPMGLFVDDLDNDGKPEIVTSNDVGNTISVLRNTSTISTISFAAKVDFPITPGANSRSLTIADIDGDQKHDMISITETSNTMSIFRNTSTLGSISFAAKINFTTGTLPRCVDAGDLNNDGKLDLVVANNTSNTLSIFRNTSTPGTISLAAKVDITSGTAPQTVCIGDIDGNGLPDLAYTNMTSGTVVVRKNNSVSGSIAFATAVNFTPPANPYGLTICDLNGDGLSDLISTSAAGSNASVFKNQMVTGPTMTSAATKTICSGISVNHPLTSSESSTYTWIAGSNPNISGESTSIQSSGTLTDILINTASTAQTVTYTVTPTSSPAGCVGATQTVTVTVNPMPSAAGVIMGTDTICSGSTHTYSTSAITNATSYIWTMPGGWTGTSSTNAIAITPNAASGSITVSGNNACGNGINSSKSLTVNICAPPIIPTVISFSPAAGPVGTTVVITGNNFNTTAANNIVFFGATRASVSAASATSLTVIVPIGATHEFISVTNYTSQLTGYSSRPFITTYLCGDSLDIQSFSPEVNFTTGSWPNHITMGDVDGDGKSDLAVTNYTSSSISVLLNTSSLANITFAPKVDLATGLHPEGVSIMDLDGDGKSEIIASNYDANTISVFKNTCSAGTISFAPKVDFPTGGHPMYMSIGDLNADGKPEIVVPSQYLNTVSVLQNTCTSSSISFAPRIDFASGVDPINVSIGDLDGDGKPDLSVANQTSSSISVYRNTNTTNTISFAPKIDFTTGGNPFFVSVGDLDNDNKSDLVTVNQASNTVSVFRNISTAGTISFSPKVDINCGTDPRHVSITDMDGDGKTDLLVGNTAPSSVSLLKNNCTAGFISFSPAESYLVGSSAADPTFVIGGDLDSDGKPDMALISYSYSPAANQISVIRNNTCNPPHGTITSFTPHSGPVGTTVTITGTNFNTTLANNIVFFGATRATIVSGNDSTLVVTVPMGATYQPISVTDFINHLTEYTKDPFVVTFTSCGGGVDSTSFTTDLSMSIPSHTSTLPGSIAISDIDGDGKSDLAVSCPDSAMIAIYRNTGTAGSISFAPKINIYTGTIYPHELKIGDLNADGKPDMVSTSRGTQGTISCYRNTSTPGIISFTTPNEFSPLPYSNSVSIADLDLDGKPELTVYNNPNNQEVAILRNTSTYLDLSFAPPITFPSGNGVTSAYQQTIVTTDIDGDGKPDISLVSTFTTTQLSTLRNLCTPGTISFAPAVTFTTDTNSTSLHTGDIDGDGKQDLVVVNQGGANSFSVFRNTSSIGNVSYAPREDFTLSHGAYSLTISDLDGDGKVDIATGNYSGYHQSIFKNNSSPGIISFAPEVELAATVPSTTYQILTADINNDGKCDLVGFSYLYAYFLKNNVTGIVPHLTSIDTITICSGDTINSLFTSNTPSTYQWIATDNTNTTGESTSPQTSGTLNDVVTNLTSTTQTITYAVTPTSLGGCPGSSQNVFVLVQPAPSAAITASGPTTLCTGDSVTLTSSATTGNLWSTSDTSQSIVINTSGVYSVITSNLCGSDTSATITIVVSPSPSANITTSGSTTFCSGDSVTLTSSSAIGNLWSTSDTTQSIVINTSGVYSVITSNLCGSDTSATITIVVSPSPSASITTSGSTTFCSGDSVTLTSSTVSNLWSTSDTTQSIVINTTGVYTVIASNSCGSDTSASVAVVVNPLPSANITTSGSTTLCSGDSVTLTSSSAIGNLWSTSDTTQSIVINTAGVYSVIVSNSCGSDTSSTIAVVVNPLPSASITTSGSTTFCSGDSVMITSGSSNGNLWSTSDTTQSITISVSGNYTLINSNSCGSDTSSTINVIVNPIPATPTISLSGNILSSSALYGNLWYLDAVSSTDTSQNHTITQNGSYSVVVSLNGCSATSAPYIINTFDVWPGDANHDSIVNNFDLLPIGIFYSQTGPARSSVSNNWQAYYCSDWGTSQTNGADIKHTDCDGDGVIDDNDTLAINLNFSSTHALAPFSADVRSTDPSLYFVTSSSVYLPGDWVDIDIMAGTNSNPVENLYGLAFNLNYDASLVQTGTESVLYPASWLGDPTVDAIKFSRAEAMLNTTFAAETRIDHTNRDGYGRIAILRFQVSSTVSSLTPMNFSFSGYSANDSIGNILTFNDSTHSILIDPLATNVEDIANNSIIGIHPNPFSDHTEISYVLNEKSKVIIEIFNSLGQKIETIAEAEQPAGTYQFTFSANQKGYTDGIYLVKMSINGKVHLKRIVEIK